jgi:hypothetical protein
MPAQRKSNLPAMTPRDREFDALLRHTAQRFEQVTTAEPAQKTLFKKTNIVANQTSWPART